jgi:hypothetical protein
LLAHLHTTLELPGGARPSANQLGKALSLVDVRVDAWDPSCSVDHGAADEEPLFRLERCTLSALLPLLRGAGIHSPLSASLDVGPVALRCCTAQMKSLAQLMRAHSHEGAPAQLVEAQRTIDRQAACIALLLHEVDELREAKHEADLANTIISASLKRHIAAMAVLQAENAEMLERRGDGRGGGAFRAEAVARGPQAADAADA